jgi:hypothetical protein
MPGAGKAYRADMRALGVLGSSEAWIKPRPNDPHFPAAVVFYVPRSQAHLIPPPPPAPREPRPRHRRRRHLRLVD